MKTKPKKAEDDLRPEYDFDYSKATRGEHSKTLLERGASVVILEPDVAKAFGNSEAVNQALRSLLDITRSTQRLTKRQSAHSAKR